MLIQRVVVSLAVLLHVLLKSLSALMIGKKAEPLLLTIVFLWRADFERRIEGFKEFV